MRAHHASPTSAALAASPQTSAFQDRSLAGTALVYLADECTLGYRRWPPYSAVC